LELIKTELREFMHFYGYANDNSKDGETKWPKYEDQTAEERAAMNAYRQE